MTYIESNCLLPGRLSRLDWKVGLGCDLPFLETQVWQALFVLCRACPQRTGSVPRYHTRQESQVYATTPGNQQLPIEENLRNQGYLGKMETVADETFK